MIYGLVFVMSLLVAGVTLHTSNVVSHRSPGHVQRDVLAQWMRVYSNAAIGFAQANPGYSGLITDAQVEPYLGVWQSITASMTAAGLQHGAELSGGQLVVWCSGSGSTVVTQPPADITNPSSGYQQSGNLVNPILGQQGALPSNVPAGATVLRVQV